MSKEPAVFNFVLYMICKGQAKLNSKIESHPFKTLFNGQFSSKFRSLSIISTIQNYFPVTLLCYKLNCRIVPQLCETACTRRFGIM